jgi:hypothetical protein
LGLSRLIARVFSSFLLLNTFWLTSLLWLPYISIWRFQDLSLTAKNPSFLDTWPFKRRPISCLETSVGNYHYTLRNNYHYTLRNNYHYTLRNKPRMAQYSTYVFVEFEWENVSRYIRIYDIFICNIGSHPVAIHHTYKHKQYRERHKTNNT